ncbi:MULTISPECIES: WXG100 family type VII secretion target [Bacillus]|uniref:WXG100 family type VII secretion target n=1 Tax=Bacillus paranthracis TaxID=2026186 RepID=A0AAX3QKB7_9BACI|nr:MULTISPECIES: WXG100 family type VII secretion target [Bacillus]MBL3844098.1 WXG100 family type VII secretion target [Bacillus cereus]MBE7116867.1 WXG100 family type VII secretion target [Bacillus paranthracis]MBE7132457.1 WXG100 family type VII secretion target [Bacillus paranthracis]MBE7152315.1 WXG100 family type VII secretion target [Bacillus paranthracis]MCU4849825.1 WXG100 family type VII secretion target [Bacillus paranthracis]
MEIKVKPEQLEQIAKNISEMQTHSQTIQQNLNQSMFSIQMQWQGATSQHFYGEYMRSMRLMESYIRNLQVTEKELRRIAQKFRQADEEYQKKQNEKLKEAHKKEKKHEKSWWEKGIEGAAEFIGVNDAIRAVTGKDPITGKELSSKERLIAAGWTLLNFVPVGKVASLAGKGIKYVASSFGKTIVKAGKKLGEGVTMVAGKAGKAAVDGIKTASHKVKEGVNFVASTAKGFADKIGSLWNKGATTVKTTFLQGNEKIQHAVKTLMEYKWIPGEGKGFAIAGVGKVSGGGQYSLKEAYQYMESKVVKGTGKEYKNYKDVEYTGTTKVNGEVRDISRRVFQRLDIDYMRIDPKTGMTNLQLMKKGRAPIWQDGTAIELHHLIQREPGSMVELPGSMHKEYYKILHGLVENGGSFRNDPVLKKQYENFRSKYWRWRAKQIDKAEL